MVLAKMEVLPKAPSSGLPPGHPGELLAGYSLCNTRGGEASWPSCLQGLELMLNQEAVKASLWDSEPGDEVSAERGNPSYRWTSPGLA